MWKRVMIRTLKYPKKSFREYNIRQRGLGKPEISFEEYLSLDKKHYLDHRSRVHPKIKDAETHMAEVFGQNIFTERKPCIKCNHVKPLVDFLCRYKTKRVENICKECEKARKRKPRQPGATITNYSTNILNC